MLNKYLSNQVSLNHCGFSLGLLGLLHIKVELNKIYFFPFSLKSQPVGSLRVRHSPKSRYNVPSSAVSLPSIALLSTAEENGAENRPRRKSDHSPEKRRALKPVKSASGLIRPNLERISGWPMLLNFFLRHWRSRKINTWAFVQGILKGEVSLYHWPPVWLV